MPPWHNKAAMNIEKYEANTKKELTPEEVAELKKQHGWENIYYIEVKGKQCWLKPPSRVDLDAAIISNRKATSKFNGSILRNCWLAGDKEIVDEDKYFMAVTTILDEVVDFGEATLKKL
jgi:hypothetical protein